MCIKIQVTRYIEDSLHFSASVADSEPLKDNFFVNAICLHITTLYILSTQLQENLEKQISKGYDCYETHRLTLYRICIGFRIFKSIMISD